MTKIVIRYVAPDLPESNAAAKPKTFYSAGTRYARIEQEPEPALKAPNLIIVNEPDIWVIELVAKSGNHSVNPGPDLSVHNPILGADCPDEAFDFEFGHEVEFLNRIRAKNLGSKEIRGTECKTREFEAGDYLVTTYLHATKGTPVELKAFRNGKLMFKIEYLNYESALPFEASLFRPPQGIRFIEQSRN